MGSAVSVPGVGLWFWKGVRVIRQSQRGVHLWGFQAVLPAHATGVWGRPPGEWG